MNDVTRPEALIGAEVLSTGGPVDDGLEWGRARPAETPHPPVNSSRLGELPPDHADLSSEDGEPDASGTADEASSEDIDFGVVEACASLDHSDTDNGERLIRHFGRDILVLAQEEVATGVFLGWCGTHWDFSGGIARVTRIAQRLGDRIALEAPYLRHTPAEEEAIKAAKGLLPFDRIDEAPSGDKGKIKAAEAAKSALAKRRKARKQHGMTTKNAGRIESMLKMAGPRLRREPEDFNADTHVVACLTHTLRFARVSDDECPDPDTVRYKATLNAVKGHDRADLLTACLPVSWKGLAAKALKWRAFLDEMMPDALKRRTLQSYAGTSLFALSPQYIMFHYGTGANGKSVYLEILTRVLGALAVGLPRESIVGTGDRGAGAASPDLARLYARRMVRILEVKGNAPLQEDLIKKLTGGEKFPVRSLFKGYFEFKSTASPHMSGNGFPTLDGSDYGTMRRMLVMHWDQTVPDDKRRDFEEMVSEIVAEEAPGILAWLVEGALDYLENGLYIAPSVRAATDEYGSNMDPIGEFMKACLKSVDGGREQAGDIVSAYAAWAEANGAPKKSKRAIGDQVTKAFPKKSEIGGRIYYHDCILHDVPAVHEGPPPPEPYR
jgi:putative DNA primase/helicase